MRNTLRIAIFIVFLSLLTACGGGAQAANKLEEITKRGKIIVGTSADYPPFESMEGEELVGFDVDLMKGIASQMGVELEWVDMPFDSLIASVQEGKIDVAVAAFNYNEERDQVVDFTDPYYYGEDGFLVREDFAGTISAPEDIAIYKVGVQTGSTADGWVTENLLDTGMLPEANVIACAFVGHDPRSASTPGVQARRSLADGSFWSTDCFQNRARSHAANAPARPLGTVHDRHQRGRRGRRAEHRAG